MYFTCIVPAIYLFLCVLKLHHGRLISFCITGQMLECANTDAIEKRSTMYNTKIGTMTMHLSFNGTFQLDANPF